MPFNSVIDRSSASALIPEEASTEILQEATHGSSFLALARRLPDMARGERRLPVLSSLPMAYFVDEAPGTPDPITGVDATTYKQTTKVEWANKYIHAEEIACIAPIPESVLDDADYDIWGEIRPAIVQAIGQVVDRAAFYGTGAPATWPSGIVPGAIAAGNVVALGDIGSLYDDIMAGSEATPGLIGHVELDGYFPNGFVAAIPMRWSLRGLRDTVGQPIFTTSMQGATAYALDGHPMYFPLNGVINPATSLLICGDWTKAVYAIRKDISYKLLDQAAITDPGTNEIVYNLAQQDMVALRVTFRLGWQLPNPVNAVNTNPATRYPFSVLRPAS